MPQVYKRKSEKCKRSPTEILLLTAKQCDKGQSVRKATLLFNSDKMTLYRHLKNKNFWTRMCIYGSVTQDHIIFPLNLLLLLLSASPYSGSPQRDSNLHFTRSTSSPSLAPTLSMSSLTKSIHLLLGLPLFLLPGTAISIILFPT